MKKENLKPNEVVAPTLFVGVGGTGSEIVRRVAEMCRPEEVENINFICMDTNVNDLLTVANSKAKIFFVQTSNTQTVGDYLDYDEDALRNWFPKNAVMYDKTVSEGAGQVRAISRLALNSTIKTGKINPLYEAIDDLFRKSGKEMKQALRVVMASTASGGTGSGIVLPLSMFIRDYVKNKYPNTALIVRSLIMLPETLDSVISSTSERESQRRNAYSTIKEINAFMMKGSGFFDIEPTLKRYNNMHIDFTIPGADEPKSLSLLPFDFCFLMDGQDAEDSTLISLTQYKKQAAQALYEQNIGPMQRKAFSVEDNIIKEMSNPENLGRNRFGGIGASVIRYPYARLTDYVAYGWALDAIGGEGEAAKWSRYDKAYEIKLAEGRKKGLSATELPKRSEVYVDTLRTASDNFSKDLRAKYLQGENKRVTGFLKELTDYMHLSVDDNAMIKNASSAAAFLADEIDYKNDENQRGKAKANLDLLRDYENAVRMNAKKVGETVSEAIFSNEAKTINEKRPYTLEALLKNSFDEIAHPNAARALLYQVRDEFEKRIRSTKSMIDDQFMPGLELYSEDANDQGTFDVKYSRKKESNIDELVAAEKGEGEDPNIIQKLGGYEKIYESLNACFTDYYSTITAYGHAVAELEAYKKGREYLEDICAMYEKFFRTFNDKVATLLKRRDDIVDELKFTKGDSVLNICATREVMDELARTTAKQGADGSLLDSELNGAIYDAVKKNVAFEREIRNADTVEEDKRIDIFDDIIIGYFRNTVQTECDSLDMNVIEAMAMENRLQARLKMREEAEGDEQIFDKVTMADNLRHIHETIQMGERLAAPGVQRIRNEEPREVKVVAYNKTLNNMRQYRMDEMFDKGVGNEATDTISRYEMHFFNALYNLTPDKLNKFASPEVAETRVKNAGLYHNAYVNYSKYLGPDSTKNLMISTHIDKRWDSIAMMPELDFKFMNRQIMKIHKALIYALVYGAIQYKNLSAAAGGKKVYRYENSDERTLEMIVSNGTLCDEFYEILDSLYIDASIVEDINVICKHRQQRDLVRNSNYEDTTFAKSTKNFFIESVHEGPTSLFEIPLAYYNSLPNSQRFVSEIASLVDAVIDTFRSELEKWENGEDAKFMLCDVLKEQFELLMKNYHEYEKLRGNKAAADNMVIDTIYRKIKRVISSTPEPDDFETTLDGLKALIY